MISLIYWKHQWWPCVRFWRHSLKKKGSSHHVLLCYARVEQSVCASTHFSRSRWLLTEPDCLRWNLGSAMCFLCDLSYLTSQKLHFLIYTMGTMRHLLHSVLVGVGLVKIIMTCSRASAMITACPGLLRYVWENPASSLSGLHCSKLSRTHTHLSKENKWLQGDISDSILKTIGKNHTSP